MQLLIRHRVTALLHRGQLNLLQLLYGQGFIPLTVAKELESLIHFGFDISFLGEGDICKVMEASDTNFVKKLSRNIDAGEAEAIALAKELKADLLLIDEKLGKQFAETQNIACKEVVGILIEAKKRGLLPLLDDLLLNLKFRLSDKIYQLALKKAGE